METKISPFLLIKLTLEKMEYICEQMDFLILSPSTGRTTSSLHTGQCAAKLYCYAYHGFENHLEQTHHCPGERWGGLQKDHFANVA